MKLSEAIRLGSTLKPHAVHYLYDGQGTCAFGAALDAIGRLDTENVAKGLNADVLNIWFWLNDFGQCPHCHDGGSLAAIVAAHLNDAHGWTREQIAAWVASIEPPDAPAAQETVRIVPIITTAVVWSVGAPAAQETPLTRS